MMNVYYDGDDPEVLEARSKIPEPTRTDNPIYYVLLPAQPVYTYKEEQPYFEFHERTRITFEKKLVHCTEDVTFWAWVCTRDGKIYL